MKNNIKNKLINSPVALLLFLNGIAIFLIAQQGINDLYSKIIYIFLSILFIISSILLVILISKITYIFTIAICTLYIIFFVGLTIYILKTDETGQGLVGLLFLAPQAVISILALPFSIYRFKKVENI